MRKTTEELFDICDEHGQPTGEVVERSIAHRDGVPHRTAHVWVTRVHEGKQQILLQLRSRNKDSFPGMYDTSSAGHIPAGDEPIVSAARELKEELGLEAAPDQLKYVGFFHAEYEIPFHGSMFWDNEYVTVYLYDAPVSIEDVRIQEEELEAVEWFDLDEVYEECRAGIRDRFCVPMEGLELLKLYLQPEAVKTTDRGQQPEDGMVRELFQYIRKKYKTTPEYPWRMYDTYAVFRHADNRKWFALVMEVSRDKLGLKGTEEVPVINLKVDDLFFRDMIIREEGIMPAYHMNKLHWITVLLDGTVPKERVYDLLEMSYLATASVKKKEKIRPPKDWIVPANPKFYDVIGAFEAADEIDWKQGSGIKKGDTVFLYVASPVSAILYKCRVLETDIPYDYSDQNLTIKALMKIRLLKRYESDQFSFEVLKNEYGIYAIRGPRGIPNSLSRALK